MSVHDDVNDEIEREFQAFRQAVCKTSQARLKKQRERFVKVPLWWMEQAMQASGSPAGYLCVWMLFLSWKTGSKTIALPNKQLRQAGVSRNVKQRHLAKWEAAGLLKVERRHGKTVIVTLNY
jgi:hypothetical protein